jgi:hypothetical protein
LANHGEIQLYAIQMALTSYEVELRNAIRTAISSLIELLNGSNGSLRLATVSLLTKLAEHGKFVAVCCLDITNVRMKSNFAMRLGLRFHHLLRC